jgi:tight adherence protein B
MPYRRLLSIAAGRLARRRGERAGVAQLALVVEILAAHVRAGRSLRQALADAPPDLPEPAAGRVAAAAADAALGTPAADALAALGEGRDVAYLAAAVRLHTRSGGDLALLLERTAELLHERAAQRHAAEVATAQARATGRIVTAMPALGVAALYVADRSGFDLLVRSPLGWLALLVSAGLAALGHLLIVRISAVDP